MKNKTVTFVISGPAVEPDEQAEFVSQLLIEASGDVAAGDLEGTVETMDLDGVRSTYEWAVGAGDAA